MGEGAGALNQACSVLDQVIREETTPCGKITPEIPKVRLLIFPPRPLTLAWYVVANAGSPFFGAMTIGTAAQVLTQ